MALEILERQTMTCELIIEFGIEAAAAIAPAVRHHAQQPAWDVGVNEVTLLKVVHQDAQTIDLYSRRVLRRTMNERVVAAPLACELDERLLPGEAGASPREFLFSDGAFDVLVLHVSSEFDNRADDEDEHKEHARRQNPQDNPDPRALG